MQWKKHFAWLLMPFIFLFIFLNGYGHYFVHEFLSHEDTVHNNQSKTGYSYESEHLHCEVLDIYLMEFDLPVLLSFEDLVVFYTKIIARKSSQLISNLFIRFYLRGPPFEQ